MVYRHIFHFLMLCRVMGLMCLALVLVTVGCSHSRNPRLPGTPLTTGYDPAWSPNGSRIAYVQALYEPAKAKDARGGIWLANSTDNPAPRQAICIWDLRANKRELINAEPDPQTVITSLVWKSDDELLYLASRMNYSYYNRLKYKEDLHWLIPYRAPLVNKDLMVCNISTSKTSLLASSVKWIWNMEAGREKTEEAFLWECARLQDKRVAVLSYMKLPATGKLESRVTLPLADWNGDPWATARTLMPVGVRSDDKQKSGQLTKYLARIHDSHYEDFYGPSKSILGVFGSPDGKQVAFYEDTQGNNDYIRVSIKIISINGGMPLTVANDACPWSYIAWSPDGKKIAYANADDGKIKIVEVPVNPK